MGPLRACDCGMLDLFGWVGNLFECEKEDARDEERVCVRVYSIN